MRDVKNNGYQSLIMVLPDRAALHLYIDTEARRDETVHRLPGSQLPYASQLKLLINSTSDSNLRDWCNLYEAEKHYQWRRDNESCVTLMFRSTDTLASRISVRLSVRLVLVRLFARLPSCVQLVSDRAQWDALCSTTINLLPETCQTFHPVFFCSAAKSRPSFDPYRCPTVLHVNNWTSYLQCYL